MKIQCSYCGNMFNDTLEKCPNCGAPNQGVVRSTGDQPLTIQDLQRWYADRGLPPYETTRFFIGINYKKPRAFGIYKDERTGNFVVYKNKDNGQRAVRYEGTDEAYAVNELYQRLKQEIIQQKRRNISRNPSSSAPVQKSGPGSFIKKHKILSGVIAFFLVMLTSGTILLMNTPEEGYYRFEGRSYYAMSEMDNMDLAAVNMMYWFTYDTGTDSWSTVLSERQVPSSLIKKRSASQYYQGSSWSERFGVPNFQNSVVYDDLINGYRVSTGYYSCNDWIFYHLTGSADSDWYYYDTDNGDWYSIEVSDIPEELTHHSSSVDFYYTPVWDESTQITDFADTSIYQEYQDELERERSSWENDDDDDDYDWGSDDSWDSGGTDWSSDW